MAAAVRYLAGPESGWVTGVNFPVDGGHHLRGGPDYGLLLGGVRGAAGGRPDRSGRVGHW